MKSVRSLWDSLAQQQGMTMFQGYQWNVEALTAFREREIPRVVLIEDDSGVALLPCVIGRKCQMVHFAGEAMFDYRTALFRGDESVLHRAWETVADWGLPMEIKALLGDVQREPWQSLPTKFFVNAPGIDAAETTHDEFIHAHSRLGRHSRRIRKQGVELRRHSGTNRALVSLIYDLKAKQDTAQNLFTDPLRRELMIAIAERSEAPCEIFTYETPGTLVAALLTFRDRSIRRCYTTYFDRAWATYSPGQVLLFDVAAASLEEGLSCDFMTGEYPYKNRIATQMVPLYTMRASSEELRAAARRPLPERVTLAA